jgi:hypothetical protein
MVMVNDSLTGAVAAADLSPYNPPFAEMPWPSR